MTHHSVHVVRRKALPIVHPSQFPWQNEIKVELIVSYPQDATVEQVADVLALAVERTAEDLAEQFYEERSA